MPCDGSLSLGGGALDVFEEWAEADETDDDLHVGVGYFTMHYAGWDVKEEGSTQFEPITSSRTLLDRSLTVEHVAVGVAVTVVMPPCRRVFSHL